MRKRVVVTGLGVISCLGIGKDEFWNNLIKGKSGISRITSFDTSQHFTHYGGEIKNFEAKNFINPKKTKLMGRTSLFAIATTGLALRDAGLGPDYISKDRIGVCLGTAMGEVQKLEEIDRIWLRKSIEQVKRRLVYQYITNMIAVNVALEFNFSGISRVFVTACTAGNYAIAGAYDLLQNERIDIAIAGGVDSFTQIAFTGFNQLGAIAPKKCQPFDKNRKGMILGEGAGILILEPLERALEREANIYAELLGYGLSCDAFHMTEPAVEGIEECIRNALKDTQISADEIDYISAHGTGTIHNDRAECAAIKNVFKDRYKNIPISSIKSMLGHTMGAASAIEAISCCLTIKNSIVPPTINYKTPDPECDIDCVPNAARNQKVNVVLNNSFAFGGNNVCLVLKGF